VNVAGHGDPRWLSRPALDKPPPMMAVSGSGKVESGRRVDQRAAADFVEVPPFEIRGSDSMRVPFVFSSPHSGRHYPPRFMAMSRLGGETIRRSEDCYVDELFGGALMEGAPLLAANFPRAYLDVNREPFELDPRMFEEPLPAHANFRSPRVAGGLGTIPRLVGDGLDIYGRKLPLSEAVERIEAIYRPYHESLKGLLSRAHAAFGHAILVDCHSMPASIRTGEGGLRPDFIVGDRFGRSAAPSLVGHVIELLEGMGYSVAYNKPYAGGFITEHYGRPMRGFHAVQIEVNRGLYLNERTYRKTAGFDGLARDLTLFCERLMAPGWDHLAGLPVAAE
jgi:N-formylglutamate amidohydrolase